MTKSSNITIKPEALMNVQNSFNTLSAYLSDASSIVGDSASIEAIEAGNSAIQTTASETKVTLDSFDCYLTGVAAAFTSKDNELSVSVTQTMGDPSENTELQTIKNSDSYKKLMSKSNEPKASSVANFRKLDEASR